MVSFRKRKGVNIGRVITKITVVTVALYAGGIVMTSLGTVMNGTSSPFYQGLSLIGWTVGAASTNGTAGYHCCSSTPATCTTFTTTGGSTCITNTTNAGILAVVGVLGIASVVMEFIEFRM